MKRLIPLAIFVALSAGAATSAAQAAQARVPVRRPALHRAVKLIRLDQPRHGVSPLALAGMGASSGAGLRPEGGAALPGPDQPGWLKDKDHAGWGWSDGRTETVMGLYHRSPQPDFLRNADLIQGGHGAAGVAMSFKLGG